MSLNDDIKQQLGSFSLDSELDEHIAGVEIICLLRTLAHHAKRRPLSERRLKDAVRAAKNAMRFVDYVTAGGDHVLRRLPPPTPDSERSTPAPGATTDQ